MHSKNFKHLQGYLLYLMKKTFDCGFDIITEKKKRLMITALPKEGMNLERLA